MIKKRFSLLDPLLLARLKRTSRRFAAIRAGRGPDLPGAAEPHAPSWRETCDGSGEIVVASYNIHKCVGTDGRFDPGRIARVIAELDADVVAIQEADERFGRRRGLLDLKALNDTGLHLVPASVAADGHGWHGNALLIKSGEVRKIRRLALPGAEPRGALVADLDLPGGPLRIVAAHLGLLRRSRRWQIRAILEAIEEGQPVPTLVVGDLNEWKPGKRSSLHGFHPMFGPLPDALHSFPSYFPVVALDRVIGSPSLVTALEVHDSPLAAVASDHLPLKARINIQAALQELPAKAA